MHESIIGSVASPVLDRNLFIYVSVCALKSTVSFSTITGLFKPKKFHIQYSEKDSQGQKDY